MSATSSRSHAQHHPRHDRHDRADVAATLDDYDTDSAPSQRAFAREASVPRSTLRYWLARKAALDLDPALVTFFSSAVGLAFLHRLVMATHLCVRLLGAAGERCVGLWLKMTGLDAFVASSAASCHLVAQQIDDALADFDDHHAARAKAHCPAPRPVHVALDELFRPTPILTLIDVPSGYNLEIVHVAHRDEATWTRTLKGLEEQLPIVFVQGVGDEAKGLVNALEKGLGVPHHTDVFHPQMDITRTTAASLKLQVKEAEQEVKREEKIAGWGLTPRLLQTQSLASQAEMFQSRMARAIRTLSEAMHPIDLESGEAREPEEVERELRAAVGQMKDIAEAAKLRPAALQAIEKAERLVGKMAATVGWWQRHVVTWVKASKLREGLCEVVLTVLVPALYVELASERAKGANRREILRDRAEKLVEELEEPGHLWQTLTGAEKAEAEALGRLCVGAFLRSSSCVEGLNGWVSLHGHGWHGLPAERLRSLKVLGNHLGKDAAGKTAYERLFGVASEDVFEWLLDRVDLPAWPSAGKKGSDGPRSLLN